ncbi:hypothetical protein PR048_014554 [Dryococelus australis]|uniref:Uncharacterized protein n=1 Tax=Dryococelus australis TaxID=614101 RepID=A0ABQ9HEY7_9NEOP|nr:hypothetical protein PR048_014554 [Dryococelus australis]
MEALGLCPQSHDGNVIRDVRREDVRNGVPALARRNEIRSPLASHTSAIRVAALDRLSWQVLSHAAPGRLLDVAGTGHTPPLTPCSTANLSQDLQVERCSLLQCGANTLCGAHSRALKTRGAVAERLTCSPPTKTNRVQPLTGSLPGFRKWESFWTIPLVGGFSRGDLLFPPSLHYGAAPHAPHFTLHRLSSPDVKSRPNLFTHSLKNEDRWLDYSPPTFTSRARFPARGRPPPHLCDLCLWERRRTMPLVGGFSRRSPVYPSPFILALFHTSPRFILVGALSFGVIS